MFHVPNDVIDIILNIWQWRKTIKWFNFIISRWSYNFEFIIFVPLSYIFQSVISRSVLTVTSLFEISRPSLFDRLRKNLCGSFVLMFFMFMYIVPMINNQLISLFIVCPAKNSFCFMIELILCFRFLSTSLANSEWKFLDSVLSQACFHLFLLPLL